MAGVVKECSSVPSPTHLTPLPQPSPFPCPRQEKQGCIHHYLPSQETDNFFSFLTAHPFFHQFRRHFWRTGRSSTNSYLMIWIMESCLWPPSSKRQHFQDIIFNEMAFEDSVSPFFPSQASSVVQCLKWVYRFPWKMVCKTGKALQRLPSRYEGGCRNHKFSPQLQWDWHPSSTWIKYKFLCLPWSYSPSPSKARRAKGFGIPLFLQGDVQDLPTSWKYSYKRIKRKIIEV